VEWRGLGVIERQLVREGQSVKYAEAPANGGFSILEGIPGKADPRLEILIGGVPGEVRIAASAAVRGGGIGEQERQIPD